MIYAHVSILQFLHKYNILKAFKKNIGINIRKKFQDLITDEKKPKNKRNRSSSFPIDVSNSDLVFGYSKSPIRSDSNSTSSSAIINSEKRQKHSKRNSDSISSDGNNPIFISDDSSVVIKDWNPIRKFEGNCKYL